MRNPRGRARKLGVISWVRRVPAGNEERECDGALKPVYRLNKGRLRAGDSVSMSQPNIVSDIETGPSMRKQLSCRDEFFRGTRYIRPCPWVLPAIFIYQVTAVLW